MIRRRSSGSITPVWLVLLMSALFLMILFVDREWVNYQIRKAQQTADFAAEVGSASVEVIYHLRIEGISWVKQTTTTCNPQDPLMCHTSTWWEQSDWHNTCSGNLKELSGNGWLERCGCYTGETDQISAFTECRRATEEKPEPRWPLGFEDEVVRTFRANWVDRPNSHVSLVAATKSPADRRTTLFVQVQISSLFGSGFWRPREVPIFGNATIQIPPLKITTPPAANP